MRMIQKRMVTYISLLILQLISPRDLRKKFDDDDTCTASNPILAYSEAGNPIGYVVNIFKNGQKNGYVILDARQDNIVTRFSFGPNILNPWESMQKDEILLKKAPKLNQNDSGRLVMASPLDFGIADNELTSYVTPDCQSIIPISRTASLRSSVQWGDIPIPVSIFHSTYKVNSSAYIGELPYATETEIERNTKRYACAVTALFSVAGRLYLNGKPLITATSMFGQLPDWNEYISIWSATNTTTAYIKNGIEYGSTKSNDLGPGFVSYCNNKGYNLQESHAGAPIFEQFKQQIANNCNSIFTAQAISNGSTVGHSMAVAGWVDATRTPGNDPAVGHSYLYVYDGWNGMAYIDYNYPGFTSTFGTFFSG